MAMQLMLLDIWGILAAIGLGVSIFYFGGAHGLEYLVLMFIFLFSGTFVTVIGKQKKEEEGIYEYGRGWRNVISNSIVSILALAISLPISPFLYFGSLASVAADKFSSEIGALGGEPYFLLGMKKVKKGTSGAVTVLGTVAGFVGAFIISVSVYLIFPQYGLKYALLLAPVGLLGSMVDSIAGILETNGFGTKETSNIAGALAGAILGVIVSLI